MVTFGITGGIGSGKSVVSRIMQMVEIPVYIADLESKILLDSSESLKQELQEAYGSNLYVNGHIDRQAFAAIIFNDAEKLKRANAIIHPHVKTHFLEWLEIHRQNRKRVVATESAILYQAQFDKLVDKVILVYSPFETRIERAMKRDNSQRKQVEARIKNQIADEEFLSKADFVIHNDESHSLIDQITTVLKPFID